jgi:hypothetical protein
MRTLLAAALVVVALRGAQASDAYLVRFNVARNMNVPILVWHDEALLFNRTSTPAVIHIIGISNGTPTSTTPDTFIVPPNGAMLLEDAIDSAWQPSQSTPFILHLGVPPGVSIESRDEFYVLGIVLPAGVGSLGHASMPVFTSLTPAGTPQVHLGTDLGEHPSRTNVIVYNAGNVAGTAHIELRRTCDNSLTDERTVVVPANTTMQIGGLVKGSDTCTIPSAAEWMRYTVVTIDQPGLSLVSNVTETQPGFDSGRIPTVDLAISHETTF